MIFGVLLGIAAANRVQRRAAQAEILGRHGVHAHRSIAQLGDAGLAGKRNFVQAVVAVHHERAPHAQFAQRPRHQLRNTRGVNADDLRRSSRRIGQRAEQD